MDNTANCAKIKMLETLQFTIESHSVQKRLQGLQISCFQYAQNACLL